LTYTAYDIPSDIALKQLVNGCSSSHKSAWAHEQRRRVESSMQYIHGPQISSPAVLRRNLVHSPSSSLSTSQQATIGLLNSTLALMPPQGHHHWTPFRLSVKQDFEKKTTHLIPAPLSRPQGLNDKDHASPRPAMPRGQRRSD
jgi:hypothetical protein